MRKIRSRLQIDLVLFVTAIACSPITVAETPRLNVPFIPQEKNGCGPASIAMVEQYWSSERAQPVPAEGAESLRVLSAAKGQGTSLADMRRYLDSNGYYAFTIRASAADLSQQISKGRAPIVALKMKRGADADLHYVVVTGIDSKTVRLNDPGRRKPGSLGRAKFDAAWSHGGNWMLLGVPRRTESN